MFRHFRFPALSGLLFSAGLLFSSPVARAQTAAPTGAMAAHGYDFLTVTTIESNSKNEAKLLITPAFQGQSETALTQGSLYNLSKRDLETIARNTQIINQQLSAITAAGWELLQVYSLASPTSPGSTPPITRYLFRKAKN